MDVRQTTSPRRIEVQIDELVLHGLPPAHRHAIGDAVAHELERLLADHAGRMDGSEVERADAGTVRMHAQHAERTGRNIARAVHGALLGAASAPQGGGA